MASKMNNNPGQPDKATPSPTQYFSLRWNNHSVNLVTRFTGLYQSETLTDVTLAAEGKHLQAHKMLLSACSDYFQSLFSVNPCQHPIVILKDVNFEDLQVVVQFMYNGIVNVSSEKLPDILKTAETLQIKGLAEKFTESVSSARRTLLASSSFASSRHLSVPSVGSRQLSTESLPEYFQRTHSPRQASFESRQYSLESTSGIPMTTTKRPAQSPPLSPSRLQFRKKFRRMSGCGSSSERGNSVEDDRSPGNLTSRSSPPPTAHLSPTRQSSSSTDGGQPPSANNGSTTTTVAKKKRELFSARSSRSGGSNKSSEASFDLHSFSSKHQDSAGSSGDTGRQGSGQSMDEPNVTTINLQSSLTVPPPVASAPPPSTSCSSLSARRTSLGRAQSAGAAVDNDDNAMPTDLSLDVKSPLSDTDTRGSTSSNGAASSKRNRFLLKRQDCLERGCDNELDLTITPTIIKSTPGSPMMSLGSPPAPPPPPVSSEAASLIPSFSLDSNPEFLNDVVGPPPPPPPPPPLAHRLPSVRVIPDALDPLILDQEAANNSLNYGLLHPNFRSSLEYGTPLIRPAPVVPPPAAPPPNQRVHDYGYHPTSAVVTSSTIYHSTATATPPPSTSVAVATPLTVTEQFTHCPKEREGPALGCNFCWNTTDVNGRILRRKTKYHCPDCQANLCIVPCFQAYHEALEKEKNNDQKT